MLLRLIFIFVSMSLSIQVRSEVEFKFAGMLERGSASDGLAIQSSTAGYGVEFVAGWRPSAGLSLGPFIYSSSMKTLKVKSGGGVQNFHIAPRGYGLDFTLHFRGLYIRMGAGLFTAEARKVEDTVGYFYELKKGKGFHLGVGYGSFITPILKWTLLVMYRRYTFDEISAQGNASTFTIPNSWEVSTVGLGFGLILTF